MQLKLTSAISACAEVLSQYKMNLSTAAAYKINGDMSHAISEKTYNFVPQLEAQTGI